MDQKRHHHVAQCEPGTVSFASVIDDGEDFMQRARTRPVSGRQTVVDRAVVVLVIIRRPQSSSEDPLV